MKKAILDDVIKPNLVPFLSPQQLCPESWADILYKKQYIEVAYNDVATTDIYKCYKCGARRCKITELQIRSCDEPSTKFITCLECYTTFCK